jgi:hypothetical protein
MPTARSRGALERQSVKRWDVDEVARFTKRIKERGQSLALLKKGPSGL